MNNVKGCITIKKGRPNYHIVLDYMDSMGKRCRPTINTDIPVKGNNKRRAKEKLEEVLAEYKSTTIDLGKDILFVDFMAQWLETRRETKAIAPTTYDGYKLVFDSHIKPYFEPLRLKVKDITPSHLEKYVSVKTKTLSTNTVLKHLHNISPCLDKAVRQNIIAFNPVQRIDKPMKEKYTGATCLTQQQIEQLLNAVKGDVFESIIVFGLFYGLRRSELAGLKWSAIDMEKNQFTIKHIVTRVNKVLHKVDRTKTKSSYGDMPIPSFIKPYLENIMQSQAYYRQLQPNDFIDEGYVFTGIDGKVLNPNYISKRFTQLLKQNGLPHVRFHDLRHSSAGYLHSLGLDMKYIQTWLRHGDIGTTMNLYVKLGMDAKNHVADILDQKFQNLWL